MKARESGMPDEAMWESFFAPKETLAALGLTSAARDAAEFGCGYGTFTIPAARTVAGTAYAFDIEPDMIQATRERAGAAGLANIATCLRDFVAEGTGLADAGVDYAMLFNILHAEYPDRLLAEAYRILRPGGLVAIMHWNHDPTTPRGPSMEVRPRSEQCRAWAEAAGFAPRGGIVDLPPYHYGMTLIKP